jgi:hypothetical protein
MLREAFIAAAVAVALAGAGRAAAEPREPVSLGIVILGPDMSGREGPFEVAIRVFEAEDPDAPPHMSTLAAESLTVPALAFPLEATVRIPAERLAGAVRPAVGVIVSRGGSMALWTDAIAPLSRTGRTSVRVVAVP